MKVAELENEKAELEDKLTQLQELEERVARMRLSRTAREAEVNRLEREIESIKREIAGVQRQMDEKERMQAKELVPSGSRRPAVFMECDSEGVWIMPERKLLEVSVPLASRGAFLARVKSKGYVVFLIRPGGFKAFERYREVLETHNKTSTAKYDYGYEPVNADWKLVYPNE